MRKPLHRRPGIWFSFLSFALIFLFVHNNVRIMINFSESIPHRYFLALKNMTPKKGDYVIFTAEQNGIYPPEQKFVKKIVGVAGDVITHKNDLVFINGVYAGDVFSSTQEGKPLTKGPEGIIPEGFYYVLGEHPRSFDSRYNAIGWVHESAFIARAIAIH